MSRAREPAAPRRQIEAAFERRAARAEALGAEARTAAEPLRFAAGLYRVQGRLAATVESAHAGRPLRGRLETDLESFHYGLAEALRFAAESGPSALAEVARAGGRDELSGVRSLLLVFWRGDSEPGAGDYLSRALLRPYVEVLRGLGIAPDRAHGPGECPFCGGAPWIAARRSESDADGARRQLGCALCGEEWPFGRIQCPCCFEEEPTKLPSFQSETYPTVRIEACETCRRYVKSIDLTADARAIPEVDDLVSLGMDFWAQEEGYARVAPGLAGI
jgi:formate dehydrogenase maturation protein FdhE